jgi:SagB-type dehydrogenase family enzyme
MFEVYEETALTKMRVARLSGYTDWSSQPSIFKHYPDFLFRYKFGENELLHVIELSRMITSKRTIGSKPYYQLNTPSAGNLHPIELYVQVRGIKGVLSGIYHVNAGENELVLIKELVSDGIEPYVGLSNSLNGFIFLVSTVPFRAEWKYSNRSVRYCYLDAGHQIGSIVTALKLYKQELTILSEYNNKILNEVMGFKDNEFITAVIASGTQTDKKVKLFKQNCMYVSPTDYSELSEYVERIVSNSDSLKCDVQMSSCELTEKDIFNRRSTRFFDQVGMSEEKLEYFLNILNQPTHSLVCYNIVLNDRYIKPGIYMNSNLIKEGSFSSQIVSYLVDQKFVKNADVVTVITSKFYSENKLMQAGAYAHNLYMEAQVKELGFSGIGAFYDKKLQNFLETENYILYVCALGNEKKEQGVS